MKLAVSGTYSSGKTRSVMALSHYTGIPRTLAKAIREIMPEALPGKALAEVASAEFLQLMMRRHVGRAVHEALLGDDFLSDGSSLQEWLYGAGAGNAWDESERHRRRRERSRRGPGRDGLL